MSMSFAHSPSSVNGDLGNLPMKKDSQVTNDQMQLLYSFYTTFVFYFSNITKLLMSQALPLHTSFSLLNSNIDIDIIL